MFVRLCFQTSVSDVRNSRLSYRHVVSPQQNSATAVELDDVELACITSPSINDHDRPLAICFHGFPDTAHSWRHLMPALESSGYRVVAPHLRGYAPSSLSKTGMYQTGASAVDACALHEHFGGDARAALVGHDWGAQIVYGAASYQPARWAKVVAMAVPPGNALPHALFTNAAQLKRSWYMFFFQHRIADHVVASDEFAFLDMLWNDWSPGYDAAADLPSVRAALSEPEHLAAALGYYRASMGDGSVDPGLADVQAFAREVPSQPTLYLHGADDGCIGADVAESARALVGDNVTIGILDDVGHFLHLESPDLVNQQILEFLT